MKKQLLTTAFVMTFASTAVFAHHPSADVNPNYDSVDENISDMHNTVIEDDDMGSAAMDDVSAVTDDAVASGAGRFEGRADIDSAMESVASVDTIGLLDDVTGALSE